MLNQTTNQICNSDAIIQNQINNQPQNPKVQLQQATWSLKKKIIIISIISLIVIGIGLGLGLGIGLNMQKVTLQPVGPLVTVNQADGQAIGMRQYQLKVDNLFTTDQTIKTTLIEAKYINPNNGSRLLQQNYNFQQDFRAMVQLQQIGVSLVISPDQKLSTIIDYQVLYNYTATNQPQTIARLLQQTNSTTDQNATIADIISEVNTAFNQQLGLNSSSFQFAQTPMVQFNYDVQNSIYILDTGNSSTNTTRLLITRLLFSKKMFKKAGKLLKKAVKPVVKAVRNNLPMIASVAGALVGGVVAGPAGAASGFQIGKGIGIGVKTVLEACVPKNSLKVKCTAESVKTAVVNAGASAIGSACDSALCGKIVNKAVATTGKLLIK